MIVIGSAATFARSGWIDSTPSCSGSGYGFTFRVDSPGYRVTDPSRAFVVCGSRDWPAPWFVTAKMIEIIPRGALVITGGARRRRDLPPELVSVDEFADAEARRLGYERKVIPADWKTYGKRAGRVRNGWMLDEGPEAVLAFQCNRSPGTGDTVRQAYRRGIKLYWFTERDLRPDLTLLDAGDEE